MPICAFHENVSHIGFSTQIRNDSNSISANCPPVLVDEQMSTHEHFTDLVSEGSRSSVVVCYIQGVQLPVLISVLIPTLGQYM